MIDLFQFSFRHNIGLPKYLKFEALSRPKREVKGSIQTSIRHCLGIVVTNILKIIKFSHIK